MLTRFQEIQAGPRRRFHVVGLKSLNSDGPQPTTRPRSRRISSILEAGRKNLWMTYTQPLGNLWIKKVVEAGLKSIHRYSPSPTPYLRGGFEANNLF